MNGLYVHLPFCRRRCHYCNFTVTTADSAASGDRFLDALEAEAGRWARTVRGVPFSTVYVGGGTPSALEPGRLERAFGIVRDRFECRPDAEVTLEANPGDVDGASARLYRRLGVTRVSLGAQSFRDETLSHAHRDHDAAAIPRAVAALREAGIDNLSLDLILAMPGERIADVEASVNAAVALEPEHLSVYELAVEDRTVYGHWLRRGRLERPSEDEALEMLRRTRSALARAGYEHYELLSFARPGRRSLHNTLYWTGEPYLGLGPGAASYWQGRRFRSACTVERYVERCLGGDFRPEEEETLDPPKRRVEALVLELRLLEGASLERHAEALEELSANVGRLTAQGLLERADGRLRLSERGQLLAETVFSELSLPD